MLYYLFQDCFYYGFKIITGKMTVKEIKVGIIGFGTVGAGVAANILANSDVIASRTGVKLVLAKVADLDITTDRGVRIPEGVLTTDAAEAVYCAMNEDKFWDYYHNAIQSLWDDYQSKGYGAYKGAPEITGMPDDYWLQIGYEVGLGDQFTSCVENHETLDLLIARTSEAETTLAKAGAGLPYFSFNNFSTSGFDNNWDWDMVLEYLNAGL